MQVRLVDALEEWVEALPAWRMKESMLMLIKDVMQKLLLQHVVAAAKNKHKNTEGDVSYLSVCLLVDIMCRW
jgi:hypothetical protein